MVVLVLFLQGCSSSEDKSMGKEAETTPTIIATVTSAPTVTSIPTVAPTDTPAPVLVLPVTVNDTGKVLIQTVSGSTTYKTNSYMITSTNGEVIVVDPTSMPSKDIIDINPAAIMSTHSHPDHTDAKFVSSYPNAQTLLYTDGELQTKDFHIYSIKASHGTDTIDGSDYIMVIEVDGLRIAHMGDIGETALTKDQLKALGKIDIAFMQFENSYSNMSVSNMKGFNIIEQLDPKVIIPTHFGKASQELMVERYGEITNFDNLLEISKDDLPDKTLNVYMILNKCKYR